MNRDEFEKLLLIHGADPARWPERDRAAALALVAADPRASAMQEATRALDRAVLGASAAPMAGDLAARILARAAGDRERAAFDITPAGIAGFIAGSAGIAGAGYAIAAMAAAAVVPAGLFDTVTALAASGMAGAF